MEAFVIFASVKLSSNLVLSVLCLLASITWGVGMFTALGLDIRLSYFAAFFYESKTFAKGAGYSLSNIRFSS